MATQAGDHRLGIADRRACCVTNTRHPVWQQLRVVGEIVWPPVDQCVGRGEGALIAQLSVGSRLWPSADGTRRTVGGRASTSGRRVLIGPVRRAGAARRAQRALELDA